MYSGRKMNSNYEKAKIVEMPYSTRPTTLQPYYHHVQYERCEHCDIHVSCQANSKYPEFRDYIAFK